MKIAVTRCDGDTEILVLNEPMRISEGCIGGQACIHSADGMDHFFALDGKYDGYGRSLPDSGWTEQQAYTMIESLHQQRQIIPVTIRGILAVRFRKARQFVWWHWHKFIGTEGF